MADTVSQLVKLWMIIGDKGMKPKINLCEKLEDEWKRTKPDLCKQFVISGQMYAKIMTNKVLYTLY